MEEKEKNNWDRLESLIDKIADKNKEKSTTVIRFPGLISVLTVLFVILKATGYITWSWWWVFAPIWIPASICLGIVLLCFIVAIIMICFGK